MPFLAVIAKHTHFVFKAFGVLSEGFNESKDDSVAAFLFFRLQPICHIFSSQRSTHCVTSSKHAKRTHTAHLTLTSFFACFFRFVKRRACREQSLRGHGESFQAEACKQVCTKRSRPCVDLLSLCTRHMPAVAITQMSSKPDHSDTGK
jgi:hypothetical protein